jgi:hypothetical protein
LRLPDLRVQFALFVVEGITSRQPLHKRRGRLSPLASRMLNSDRLAGGSGSRTLAPHRGQHFSKLPRSSVRGKTFWQTRARWVPLIVCECSDTRFYVAIAANVGKSLIRRIISLMVRFNSLLGRNKFPVPLRRESSRKDLVFAPRFQANSRTRRPRRTKFPVFSQLAGNLVSETGSLETASSSGESAANLSFWVVSGRFSKSR